MLCGCCDRPKKIKREPLRLAQRDCWVGALFLVPVIASGGRVRADEAVFHEQNRVLYASLHLQFRTNGRCTENIADVPDDYSPLSRPCTGLYTGGVRFRTKIELALDSQFSILNSQFDPLRRRARRDRI